MQTRSQTRYEKKEVYTVDIDFDAASVAWKQNKRSTGNGCYVYKKDKLETLVSPTTRYNLRKRKNIQV